ncbi:hypothetical protein, partial [uncultured Sulfitobacter sp.]|uniref:hypothetical protein n=1 Tax=uncultured Sulfitobacter sp. TaxID=191468 RepID=UPI0025D80AFB
VQDRFLWEMYALEVNHRSAPIVRHLCRKITAASRDPAKVKKVCDRTHSARRRFLAAPVKGLRETVLISSSEGNPRRHCFLAGLLSGLPMKQYL